MTIPQEIRDLKPTNTIVVENKTGGPKRYAVRERAGVKYIPGKNPQPINGKVIGYIYQGKFVEKAKMPGADGPSALSYGTAAIAKSVSQDLLEDLQKCMDIEYATKLYAAALLKVVKPSVKSKRMSTEYERTFVSEWYPGLHISANQMTQMYENLGKDEEVRLAFFKLRLKKVAKDHHLLIDGLLTEDNSIVNDLSGLSFKSKVKGSKNLSLTYAYDLESKDIICGKVFPGNHTDAAGYADFVRNLDISQGIIVADKGFPVSKIEHLLKDRPDLHYLSPLKRNDGRIERYNMLEFDGILERMDRNILCKKVKMPNGKYLYSFQDTARESKEKSTYLKNRIKNGDFSNEEYCDDKKNFGTIVFLSDLDMDPADVYCCYADRWEIELVFRYYKSDADLNTTNAQTDHAVIGEMFVNTIAATITNRLVELFRKKELLKTMSYGDIMDDLSTVWRKTNAPESFPDRDDCYWEHPFEYALDLMVKLELCTGEIKYPKRFATKKKEKTADKGTDEVKIKRPRGRPRKYPVKEDMPKRPRGRPRKYPVEMDKPKRPRGRPRKVPKDDIVP